MNKSIIIAIVILALVLGAGIVEVVYISRMFDDLTETVVALKESALAETLVRQDGTALIMQWKQVRERAELFLPHTDVYELNLRMAECHAYIEQSDYKMAYAQLCIIEELTQYIPHLITPDIKHIC
ncbi:MAG: DUF4363 family protein [Clostridia bacterium]|nr:DUF4363 family protein [Clostridia bacterium]